MKITKEAYRCICDVANNENSEIGGILGSSKDGIITDVIVDIPHECQKCKFEYHPNISFLNKKIEDWFYEGKVFTGIFHTHFSGNAFLSVVDKEYIERILLAGSDATDYLYFPIYTLPDQILNVYRAELKGKELVISKENLIIV